MTKRIIRAQEGWKFLRQRRCQRYGKIRLAVPGVCSLLAGQLSD